MGLIDMSACKLRQFSVLLIIILVLATGWASAVRPTSALYDNTGITTTIDATCIGTLLVYHDMEWQQTNKAGGANLANNTLTKDETRAFSRTGRIPLLQGELQSTRKSTIWKALMYLRAEITYMPDIW